MIIRFTWIHLLQTKSQTPHLIKSNFHLTESQFNKKIKCIRSDNGTEFHMPNFFASKGTIYQLSFVETPQQNSIVEGKH